MRDYLRRAAAELWVIDCSPEGHQPEVNTRIFQGVQQPVCIVIASRPPGADREAPARVRFRSLLEGRREDKFAALARVSLDGDGWVECPKDWRAPFRPEAVGAWADYPALDDLTRDDGSGVTPGRTWVIAPDPESLRRRWLALVEAPDDRKEALFHPHLRHGVPADKHSKKFVPKPLPGQEPRPMPVAEDRGPCVVPVRYGCRSFDRQWIINQPNPSLWEGHSTAQVYLTAVNQTSPSSGPALTLTGLVPDLDHYNGRGGRVFSHYQDRAATRPNLPEGLAAYLAERYGAEVSPEAVFAYVAAMAAHPGFTSRFAADLIQPGLHIPITADGATFAEAVEFGREVIWLHTFGDRFADPARGRPAQSPRLAKGTGPRIPVDGAIPPGEMPESIEYDEAMGRLMIGREFVDGVSPRIWGYEVSGKAVLKQWFSYRGANRERPIIGDRRPSSMLGEIQPESWPAEYTSELINLLHVIGRLIEIEPAQSQLLDRIARGATIGARELREAGVLRPMTGAREAAEPDLPLLRGLE